MDLELADRVVLVTDACKEIGLACAAALIATLTGRVAQGFEAEARMTGKPLDERRAQSESRIPAAGWERRKRSRGRRCSSLRIGRAT